MKSLTKEQAAKTLVVNPSARRGCSDDQQDVETKQDESVDALVSRLQSSKEFEAVSNRILNFANVADQEVQKIIAAGKASDLATLEKAAQRLASLATEVGASDLIRICYQLLINVRQGEMAKAVELSLSV